MSATRIAAESSAVSVDQALALYKSESRVLAAKEVALAAACGRTLASDVRAIIDLPPFAQSAMDGFALRAEDTAHACEDRPVELRLAGEIPAGRVSDLAALAPMQAVKIFTGSHLPPGADTVLRQEEAVLREGRLMVTRACPAGHDCRRQGEELPKGTLLARAGTRVSFGFVAALAAAGVGRVSIRRTPKIAVVVTGDEVVTNGSACEPGEVPDANAPLIEAWLNSQGYLDLEVAHVGDDFQCTVAAFERALGNSDLILSTGGISFGDHDLVARAAGELGVREIFRGVCQRPGRPLYFGVFHDTPFLGLPGNPAAMFVGLIVHARTLLDAIEGASPSGPRFRPGRIASAVSAVRNAERWLRCGVDINSDGEIVLAPQGHQASHMVTNLGQCAALARIPAGTGTVAVGTLVPWTPVRSFPFDCPDLGPRSAAA